MKVVFGDTISTLIFDTLCAVDLDASLVALVIDSLFMSLSFLSYMVDYALNSDLFVCCWSLEI